MTFTFALIFLAFFVACTHGQSSVINEAAPAEASTAIENEFQKVDSDLRTYDDAVAMMKADFAKIPANQSDIEWVKKKLKHMVDVDQYMRKQLMGRQYSPAEEVYFRTKVGSRYATVDLENTRDLKELLKIYKWFTISRFGEEADRNAWLLVQHADRDPAFQKEILAILSNLYKSKETNSKNYAYLFDRVAASFNDPSKRTLQRYGTQGSCIGLLGKWEAIPMEDPGHINQRRAEVGLGTFEEYKAGFKEICRVPFK